MKVSGVGIQNATQDVVQKEHQAKKNNKPPLQFQKKNNLPLGTRFSFLFLSPSECFSIFFLLLFFSFLQDWMYQKLCYNWVLLFSVTHLSITLIPPTGLFIDSFPAISALKVTSLHCNLFPCSQTWTAQSSDTLAISSRVPVEAMTISSDAQDFWKFCPTRLEGIHLGRMQLALQVGGRASSAIQKGRPYLTLSTFCSCGLSAIRQYSTTFRNPTGKMYDPPSFLDLAIRFLL